jgi:hypothetical protein
MHVAGQRAQLEQKSNPLPSFFPLLPIPLFITLAALLDHSGGDDQGVYTYLLGKKKNNNITGQKGQIKVKIWTQKYCWVIRSVQSSGNKKKLPVILLIMLREIFFQDLVGSAQFMSGL